MPATETSPIYELLLWAGPAATPWVIENAIARAFEAAIRGSVLDRDLNDPADAVPCDDGACFLIDAGGVDAWAGHDGEMAIAVGEDAGNGWAFVRIATEGQILWVEDEATRIQFIAAAWSTFPDVGSLFQTTVEADGPIDAGELLNIYDDAGDAKVRLADAGDPAKFCNGFAMAAAADGAPCTIMSTGINKQVSPAATGPVWLSEATPGGYTFTAPSATGEIVQPVGTAIEGVGILFNPGVAIELG
jgi:hypothetical protein